MLLTADQCAACEILHVVGAPAALHTGFHAPAVTIVVLAVVEVEGYTDNVDHGHGERGIAGFCTSAVLVHRVALASLSEQCQVLHHDDGTCGLVFLVGCLLTDALPVEVFHTVLHLQLLVVVVVIEPEVAYARCKQGDDDHLTANPDNGTADGGLPASACGGHHNQRQGHDGVRQIVGRIVFVNSEHRQSRTVDVVKDSLIEHVVIVCQWNDGDGHHCHDAVDDTVALFLAFKAPRQDAHE